MFGWVRSAPRYDRPRVLLSAQDWQSHSSFMMCILNGHVQEVQFVLKLGVDVNQVEGGQRAHRRWASNIPGPPNPVTGGKGGCVWCQEYGSKLLTYTFWEVACIMATSDSPSLRPQKVRDLMQQYGHTMVAILPVVC
eukprot:gnl/MRDRNA2_/MRDRNA2_410529_c0_seq1.p1 gnl/MRDRNA2_/MRDRNA2_410529_c0~~gnl/MRDRNA2_/MRDRNA2_410529_c0_seq1.p1  ORF type:complete len:137 (+),score=13.12 gnl/MRDRNA2_/MRDRNA2_410529_c0_seq1:154-564(+)